MRRTSIMADEDVLQRLRDLAHDRGVSLAEVIREALEQKAGEFRPRPKCLGMFSSGDPHGSSIADEGQIPPVSWR